MLKRYILMLALAMDGLALADALVPERQKQLSLLEEYRDNYYTVKDYYYFGDTGLLAFIEQWRKDAEVWANEWPAVWQKFQAVAKTTGGAGASQIELNNALSKQWHAFLLLKTRQSDFRIRSERVISLLASKPAPYNAGELYADRIQKLTEANVGLISQVRGLQSNVFDRYRRVEALMNKAQEKIGVALEQQLAAASPEQKKVLLDLQDLIRAEREFAVHKSTFQAARAQALQAFADQRYFAAVRLQDKMRKDLETAVIQIETNFDVSEARKAAAIKGLQGLLKDVNDKIITKTPQQLPFVVIERIQNLAKPRVKDICGRRKGDASKCSLANWLARIPNSKISAYPQAKLEALEDAWTVALGGQGEDADALLAKLQGKKVPQ